MLTPVRPGVAAVSHIPTVSTHLEQSPKSGGVKGAMIALGALGCLGLLVTVILALVVIFYAIGSSTAPDRRPASENKGPVHTKSLKEFVPQTIGCMQFQGFEDLDPDTVRMLGATDALKATYAPKMHLLILNYSSLERAASALPPLRNALFPNQDDWSFDAPASAAGGTRLHGSLRTEKSATLWHWGSLIFVMWGGPMQVQEFESRYIK